MICDEVFMREVEARERTLYRISRTLLRSEADCCDAVQEALMKAWQHRTRIDESRFRAYLTRILINECHNIGRKRARIIVVETVPEKPAPQEIWQDIRDALMQLDEPQRLLLVMHHLEGRASPCRKSPTRFISRWERSNTASSAQGKPFTNYGHRIWIKEVRCCEGNERTARPARSGLRTYAGRLSPSRTKYACSTQN